MDIKQVAEITSIAKDVVLSLAGVATVFIAWLGLKTWRKELKGKSEYTKAKELLRAVYKVKDGFMHVRNPCFSSYEYPEEMLDVFGHLKTEHQYEGEKHAYEQRWKVLNGAFLELEQHNLDAQVEWGSEFQEVVVPLRKCRNELLIQTKKMLRDIERPSNRPTSSSLEEEKRSVLCDYGGTSLDGTFTAEINAAIKLFEDKLRPHIRK